MLDFRPAGYVIGLLILSLGAAMAAPALVDAAHGSGHWRAFAVAGGISVFVGGAMAGACRDQRQEGLSIQQTFFLTTLAWLALPLFGALPFILGAPQARYVDAFFEAMSGLTTTGSTAFSGANYEERGRRAVVFDPAGPIIAAIGQRAAVSGAAGNDPARRTARG